jgi:hypothetical protein
MINSLGMDIRPEGSQWVAGPFGSRRRVLAGMRPGGLCASETGNFVKNARRTAERVMPA